MTTTDQGWRSNRGDGALATMAQPPSAEHESAHVATKRPPLVSVARGAFFLLLTQPVTWAASLLGVVVVPHLLGPTVYGQYALVGAVVALAATAVCMGVQDYLVRRVAVQPEAAAQDASAALVLTTVTSLVGGIVLFIVLGRSSFPVPTTLLAVALVGIPCGAWWRVLGGVLLGHERHEFYAVLLGAVSG
jgi:O-antigen/teichoic acid export membrane protein